MPTKTKTQEVVFAILSELKESGIDALTLTSLVKFVYLADYAQAKADQGNTFTGIKWRFLHFGPFDSEVMTDIDALDQIGILEHTTGGTSKDYHLYSLADFVEQRTLESIGMAKRAVSFLRTYLQEYAKDQSRLLNFVYFHTEPMDDAQPEALLDFSQCRADTWQEIKPIATKTISPNAIKMFKDKLAAYRLVEDAQKTPPIVWQGAYDDTYKRAMTALDSDDGESVELANTAGLLIL